MELLEDLIRKRQWGEVLQQCEENEILDPSGYATPEIYAIMLGSYLARDELEHAKFLWVRIPDSFKKENPVLGDLWNVARALKQKHIGLFRDAITSVTWPDCYLTLIDVISASVTERRAALISKSYSAMHLEHMATLMGVDSEKGIEIAAKLGWDVNGETKIVSPVKKQLEPFELAKGQMIIEHLSNYVSFLEN